MTQGRFGLPKNCFFPSSIPLLLRNPMNTTRTDLVREKKREREKEKTNKQGFDDCLDEFIPLLIRKAAIKRGSIDIDCDCPSIPCVILSLMVFIPSDSDRRSPGLFTKILQSPKGQGLD